MASTRLQSLKLCAPHLCMELVSQASRMPELRQLEIELNNRYSCSMPAFDQEPRRLEAHNLANTASRMLRLACC